MPIPLTIGALSAGYLGWVVILAGVTLRLVPVVSFLVGWGSGVYCKIPGLALSVG